MKIVDSADVASSGAAGGASGKAAAGGEGMGLRIGKCGRINP